MTHSTGRPILAIPGPSIVPDKVLSAMHRPAPNIYEQDIQDLTDGLVCDLKRVALTAYHAAIYISNGHGAWEAALANVVAPGDAVLALATGHFGHGWATMARTLGADVTVIDFGTQAPVDPDRVETALRADTTQRIKAVMVTHADTSSSILSDLPTLRAAIDRAGHPALLLVDCIASFGCDRFEMDNWGVDIAVTASQKGLMMPPGLGFVFFSERAAKARVALPRVSPYWDWTLRADPQMFYQYFFGTAPTHHLFGLRAALDLILEEGMPAVWARHDVLARAIWAACSAWSCEGGLRMNLSNPDQRSRAVTALSLPAPLGTQLRKWCEIQAGVTLGIGLGMAPSDDPAWHGHFRIGHMGHINAHSILGVLGAIEAGLSALDIPHGAGALSAAATVIAEG
ncbi:aminotransferase class V-fold PLP-dependent enzyme [Roseovarius aestuarii]|nr:aminotransferase class V-fold PLP-dependent enzyme [Roseovarius aestuarii]